MTNRHHPTLGNGKICYLEIPATDIQRSAAFYSQLFGWHLRTRGDGSVAFDDAVGEVSGTWVLGRRPATEPGLVVHIMVDSVALTLEKITSAGGHIVQPIGADAPEITARFADPAGNILGLYQEPVGETIPDREMVSRRLLPASPSAVWEAWTNPERLARWWGPKGFTNHFQLFEPRPGGQWHFTMRGPDGHEYPNRSVFLGVEKPRRILLEHVSSPHFLLVATFTEQQGRTAITFRQIFSSSRERDQWKPICVPANEQNLDRLEAELAAEH
jgi:uncharacterized protein